MSDPGGGIRAATEADLERLAELFALAFEQDPTWAWAFPDGDRRVEQQRTLWSLHLHSAIPYGRVWITRDGGASSVWIPPGLPELTAEDEARYEPMLRDMLGARADAFLELVQRFADNHPHERPHYYLSLLATHPAHRGHGKGMRLLAANLVEIDAEAMPVYLESSNPANDQRYKALGFVQVGAFSVPGGDATVACMWREPEAAAQAE